MELKIDKQCRGVRIIAKEEASARRELLDALISIAHERGFNEIVLPSIEPSEIYVDKAGREVLGQMYVFQDRKGRDLCLRPEGTATIQLVADQHFKGHKDVRLWYFERCWRYERPQEGRYREFFQFGMEVINPSNPDVEKELLEIAMTMVRLKTREFESNVNVKRGLSYYLEGGFEIVVPKLGAQKQVVGGGRYRQGIGFAIGFDRLMLAGKYAGKTSERACSR